MAYKIVNNKVQHITAPNNLTLAQKRKILNAQPSKKMLLLLDKIKHISNAPISINARLSH